MGKFYSAPQYIDRIMAALHCPGYGRSWRPRLTAPDRTLEGAICRSFDMFRRRRGRNGAWGRIRTTDTRIFNPLLYQLSYPDP